MRGLGTSVVATATGASETGIVRSSPVTGGAGSVGLRLGFFRWFVWGVKVVM